MIRLAIDTLRDASFNILCFVVGGPESDTAKIAIILILLGIAIHAS